MPERCDSPGPGFPFPARPAAFTGFSRLFPQRYGFLVRFACRVEDAEPGNEHLFFFQRTDRVILFPDGGYCRLRGSGTPAIRFPLQTAGRKHSLQQAVCGRSGNW